MVRLHGQPGDPPSGDPSTGVVVQVPSVLAVLQGAWLDSLVREGLRSFDSWLAAYLDAVRAGDHRSWQVDHVAGAWAAHVGGARVEVSFGPGDVRDLTGAEVEMLDLVLADLTEQGRTGGAAAEIVKGGGCALRTTPAPSDALGPGEPRGGLVAHEVLRVTHRLQVLGVATSGDPGAPADPADPVGRGLVDKDRGASLAVGVLERLAAWGPST